MITEAEGNVELAVQENAGTRIFRRHAMRVSGQTYSTMVGELDGIRAYVRQRDGKVFVILTKDDLYE